MRALGTITLALLVALGACASTASAEPLSMTFTEARADVGIQLSVANDDDALFKPPDTAPFDAQIDPASGSITDGVLEVPAFSTHITEPIDADVTVEFEIGPITGSFDQTSGALILSGVAGGTLTADDDGPCTVSAGVLTLSTTATTGTTGGANPRSGAPFAAGLAGAGAIAGQWDDMTAEATSPEDEGFCENVEDRIGGPGGVWLEQEGEVMPSPSSDGNEDEGTPTPRPAPPPVGDPKPRRACVVLRLAGKRPARARRALRRAGCRPGRSWIRRGLKRRLRRNPKLRWRLVVKASRPRAGSTRPAAARVHLRLGLKPRKTHRKRSPRRHADLVRSR